MKLTRVGLSLLGSALLSLNAEAACGTGYSLTFNPGYTCFAVHLDVSGGNTLGNLFPIAHDYSIVYVFQCGLGWDVDYYDIAAGGWQQNLILAPGSAAFFYNPEQTPLNYTLSGVDPHLPLPSLTPGQCCLYGRPSTCANTKYADLTSTPLADQTVVYRWESSGYAAYLYDSGSWDPSEPELNTGEGAFICAP